ncbi:radical SAM protein [Chloroflexota bacterium]
MKIDNNCEKILDKALSEQPLDREEAVQLMQVDLYSPEMYALCSAANDMSRRHFNNYGDVCAQIGLDSAPCYGNCEFCFFAARNKMVGEGIKYSKEAVLRSAIECDRQKPNALLLMTTCNYDFDDFLKIGYAVHEAISPDLPLVANIPDFDDDQARALVEAGFYAVYHAVRLNEGKDTAFPVEQRIATMKAAKRAGLAVQTCVEPLGPEHSVEQQVESMFLGREMGVTFSGAGYRITVPGSPLACYGEVTQWYLARTVAVTRLVMGDTVAANCTHEPNMPSILAGANLLWAEIGTNPRDANKETEKSRGLSVDQCWQFLLNAGYERRIGPSPSVMGLAWNEAHGSVMEPDIG